MNIVHAPNDVLLQSAQPVQTIDAGITKLIKEMKEALRNSDIGIGLAAPQVGKSLRIFMISPELPNVKDKNAEPIKVFINPEIVRTKTTDGTQTKKSKKKTQSKDKTLLEGCLSLPDIWGYVERPQEVELSYLNEQGQKKQETFTGLMATIIQHETDHLNGVLFSQRALEQHERLYKTNPRTGKLVEIEI